MGLLNNMEYYMRLLHIYICKCFHLIHLNAITV